MNGELEQIEAGQMEEVQLEAKRYNVVTKNAGERTLQEPEEDIEGNILPMGTVVAVPAGTVVNTIMWDGVSEYNPGDEYELVLANTEE